MGTAALLPVMTALVAEVGPVIPERRWPIPSVGVVIPDATAFVPGVSAGMTLFGVHIPSAVVFIP